MHYTLHGVHFPRWIDSNLAQSLAGNSIVVGMRSELARLSGHPSSPLGWGKIAKVSGHRVWLDQDLAGRPD